MQERGERGEGQGIYPPSSGKMRGQDNIIFFFLVKNKYMFETRKFERRLLLCLV